jgi:hypothetical protein
VTKLNKKKKKQHYEIKINDTKKDIEKLWSTLYYILGAKAQLHHSLVHSSQQQQKVGEKIIVVCQQRQAAMV